MSLNPACLLRPEATISLGLEQISPSHSILRFSTRPYIGFIDSLTTRPNPGFSVSLATRPNTGFSDGHTARPGVGFSESLTNHAGVGFSDGLTNRPGVGFSESLTNRPGVGFGGIVSKKISPLRIFQFPPNLSATIVWLAIKSPDGKIGETEGPFQLMVE